MKEYSLAKSKISVLLIEKISHSQDLIHSFDPKSLNEQILRILHSRDVIYNANFVERWRKLVSQGF